MKFNSLIGNKYHNKRNNHKIEFNGKEATISEWSEMTNISPGTIWYRLSAGWNIEDALFKPTKHSRSKSTGERGDYL